MANKKEDIITGLELALSVVIPASQNKWVSVRELSIVKILQEASVNKNYSVAFMEVLKSRGLLETEGARAGLMLRFNSDVIPDFSVLAEEIYLKHKELSLVKMSKSSDLRPPKRRKFSIEESSGPCISIKRKIFIPKLGDSVFVVFDNKIRQAIVLGMSINSHFPNENKRRYQVDIIIPLKKYANQAELFKENTCLSSSPFIQILSVDLKDIFASAQDAADYLVRSSFNFPRDYIKLYSND